MSIDFGELQERARATSNEGQERLAYVAALKRCQAEDTLRKKKQVSKVAVHLNTVLRREFGVRPNLHVDRLDYHVLLPLLPFTKPKTLRTATRIFDGIAFGVIQEKQIGRESAFCIATYIQAFDNAGRIALVNANSPTIRQDCSLSDSQLRTLKEGDTSGVSGVLPVLLGFIRDHQNGTSSDRPSNIFYGDLATDKNDYVDRTAVNLAAFANRYTIDLTRLN